MPCSKSESAAGGRYFLHFPNPITVCPYKTDTFLFSKRVHKNSGRSYHSKFAPPLSLKKGKLPKPKHMCDDLTGEPLVQRADDTSTALVARLKAYHAQTVPVLEHYGPAKAVGVDANRTMALVWADIDAATN